MWGRRKEASVEELSVESEATAAEADNKNSVHAAAADRTSSEVPH